jgi:hypothetical protein
MGGVDIVFLAIITGERDGGRQDGCVKKRSYQSIREHLRKSLALPSLWLFFCAIRVCVRSFVTAFVTFAMGIDC